MKLVLTFILILIVAPSYAATPVYNATCGDTITISIAACPTTPPVIPPVGGGTINCPGFDTTRVITMNWANPTRMYTKDVGGFGPNDITVVQFTTGNGVSQSNNLPKIGGGEWQDPPTPRYAVLSSTPCDFGPQPMPGATQSGYTVTVPFALGGGYNYGYYPALLNNTTYYLNVKNGSCAGSCNMFFELSKPGL